MITCENLTRTYGHLTAVDRVSFSIGRGEIVGLLGHNGAGKTTIMRMMTGFLEPTAGRVLVDGRDMADHRRWARERIGYLPENGPLYPDMAVWEFLTFAADGRGLLAPARDRAVREALGKTGLADKAAHIISTLSRGYRQRVGVAQALLHRPPLLILDEPTNGLDPSQVLQMRALIRELGRESTVVLSTHILQEVEAVCDRALIVMDGRLALDRRLADLNAEGRLLVAVSGPAGAVEPLLAGIPGVLRVDPMDKNGDIHRFALTCAGDPGDAADRTARRLVEAGCSIRAIAPERRNLETVFREVNARPEAPREG